MAESVVHKRVSGVGLCPARRVVFEHVFEHRAGSGGVPPMAALDTMVAGVAGLVDSLAGGAVAT